jgi:hypothetical protein
MIQGLALGSCVEPVGPVHSTKELVDATVLQGKWELYLAV